MARSRTLIIATKNKGKIREIKHVLSPLKIRILSLLDLNDIPEIKENGKTFRANAIKKARTIANKLGALVIADDSGLEVEALNGNPGIRSARYAGPYPTTEKLCRKLLKEMRGVKRERERRSRFVCVIAIAAPSGKIRVVEGICKGRITDEMLGSKGFGYDPIFMPKGYNRTFAQMPMRLKNRISHRGKALEKAKRYLRKSLKTKENRNTIHP